MRKLVLTGGPCGGKTTAFAYLSEKLADKGYHPLLVPEAPTALMMGNATPKVYDEEVFQAGVIDLMSHYERIFGAIAASRPELNPVILCDRGLPDCPPYMQDGMYERILAAQGHGSPVEVRDRRYDAVFHLTSAAVGAEAFYTTANNPARRETVHEARVRDAETLAAWTGHPHLRVIDNSTDFAGKMHRLEQAVCSYLGIPVPIERENKYLCNPVRFEDLPQPCQRIEIEQVYLYSANPNTVLRVRKRGQHGQYVYFRTEKKFIGPGANVEVEDFITKDEYHYSLNFRQQGTEPIRKERWCFVHDSQYFELDCIPRPGGTLYLLEIELTQENDVPRLPSFLGPLHDVTGNPAYTNYQLAKAA